MSSSIVPAPSKKNVGSNIVRDAKRLHKKSMLENEFDYLNVVASRSSLFWWILILIAIPLVLTNALICSIVFNNIYTIVPEWVAIVEDASMDLEMGLLRSSSSIKASAVEAMIQEVVRDLHFVTRLFYFSWSSISYGTSSEKCVYYYVF
jgi:hypothetical protein